MQKKSKRKCIVEFINNSITVIIAVTIVAVIATAFYSKLYMKPLYTSSAALCLTYNNDDNLSCEDPYKYVNDNVETFIFSISTQDVKNNAEETLSKKDQRYKNVNIDNTEIEAEQFDDTNIVYINVTSSENKLSCDLCNVYTEIALSCARKLGGINISVMESPEISEEPSSPNIFKNCIIVAVAAFVATTLILIIKSCFDKKIKDGKEVENQLDVLFLGNIPSVDENLKKRGAKEE